MRLLCIALIVCAAAPAYSQSLPFRIDFDNTGDAAWVADHHRDDCDAISGACGALVVHELGAGFGSTDCVRITPPTSCHGGSNAQYAELTFPVQGSLSRLHVRFLIKIGSDFFDNQTDCGGGLGVKLVSFTGTGARFLTTIKGSGSATDLWSPGPCNNSTCKYEAGDGPAPEGGQYWPEDDGRFNWRDYVDQYLCLEVYADLSTGENGVHIWTQDGAFNGIHKRYVIGMGGAFNNVEIGHYYNSRLLSATNAAVRLDNVAVGTSYIGPPVGFGGPASDAGPDAQSDAGSTEDGAVDAGPEDSAADDSMPTDSRPSDSGLSDGGRDGPPVDGSREDAQPLDNDPGLASGCGCSTRAAFPTNSPAWWALVAGLFMARMGRRRNAAPRRLPTQTPDRRLALADDCRNPSGRTR